MTGALSPPWRGELAVWRRVRRYAVPRSMIEKSAERRLAGDWRGACAAANVDVEFDLDRVADRYGVTDVDRLAEDLRHFVPDLLRWHLPRVGCGRTTIAARRAMALGWYGNGATLFVVTPPSMNHSQRLRLTFDRGGAVPDNWTRDRHLFDDRYCGELLRRIGGGPARAPFTHPDGTPLAEDELPTSDPGPSADAATSTEWSMLLFERGEIEAAFATTGLDASLGSLESHDHSWWHDEPRATIARLPVSPPAMARKIARADERADEARLFHTESFAFVLGHGRALLAEVGGGRQRPLVRVGNAIDGEGTTCVARHHWRRLPDLELVRYGMVSPDELHPLVRSALFPARPAPDGPVGPPGPKIPKPVRVRCKGEWHEVRSRGGELEIPHSGEEQRREDALRAFGGSVGGCFAVRQVWRTGDGRLPRDLREQRRELFLRVQHADTEGVLALLDAGVDPHVRDSRMRTLMHQLHVMDHEVMLPILLKAGLGLEDRDDYGHTPLYLAVAQDGSAELVRALVDAGARTDVTDGRYGTSLAWLIEWLERKDLDFLND